MLTTDRLHMQPAINEHLQSAVFTQT